MKGLSKALNVWCLLAVARRPVVDLALDSSLGQTTVARDAAAAATTGGWPTSEGGLWRRERKEFGATKTENRGLAPSIPIKSPSNPNRS